MNSFACKYRFLILNMLHLYKTKLTLYSPPPSRGMCVCVCAGVGIYVYIHIFIEKSS